MDPDAFLSQESNLMMDQKGPMFSHAYAAQGQMPQNTYAQMPDPNYHPMGQRPNYGMLRMQTRPTMRPAGMVQNPPNQLRLQLQHRLQAQQVYTSMITSSLHDILLPVSKNLRHAHSFIT